MMRSSQANRKACPKDTKLVGCKGTKRDLQRTPRLFRTGDMPVLRGTLWKINNRASLFWGSGFKPRIATYDGWETPAPLRIDIQHGNAQIERVAQDIFGLTKLELQCMSSRGISACYCKVFRCCWRNSDLKSYCSTS